VYPAPLHWGESSGKPARPEAAVGCSTRWGARVASSPPGWGAGSLRPRRLSKLCVAPCGIESVLLLRAGQALRAEKNMKSVLILGCVCFGLQACTTAGGDEAAAVQCETLTIEEGDACSWRFEDCTDERVYWLRCDPETSCDCASGPLPCDDECPSVERTVQVESCRAEDVSNVRRAVFANAACGWDLEVDE
jgi:hypothetical protein